MTGTFDLTNVNNMAFYISGPKLLFETTEISTHPNSTQQESNYIYLYTTKFGTSIKIRLNRKFESTEFETMSQLYIKFWCDLNIIIRIECILLKFHWGMKALTEVHFQWSTAIHVENIVPSMLSYPNETSKECIQF